MHSEITLAQVGVAMNNNIDNESSRFLHSFGGGGASQSFDFEL